MSEQFVPVDRRPAAGEAFERLERSLADRDRAERRRNEMLDEVPSDFERDR